MTAPIVLAANLDIRAAAPLRQALLGRDGEGVSLDASRVTRLGGLCLQILLAGSRDWRARGLEFSIREPSPAFLETLELFGARPALSAALNEGAH